MSSLLAQYNACVAYIEAFTKVVNDAEEVKTVHDQQFASLLVTLPRTAASLDDVTDFLRALEKKTNAFTANDRAELAKIAGRNAGTHSKEARMHPKTQSHLFVHDYLPDSMWTRSLTRSLTRSVSL